MNTSLRRNLSRLIAGVTIVSSLAAGACSFLFAFRGAQELQDEQLRQVSLLVERSGKASAALLGPVGNFDKDDPDAQIFICRLGEDAAGTNLKILPINLPEGFQTLQINGVDWRLFVSTLPGGTRIATAQMTSVRNEIARNSGLSTLFPILLLVPTLSLLSAWLIRRSLAPVTLLAGQLNRRDESNLSAVTATDVPSEMEPFVAAINSLMERLGKSLTQQRRFIADAAHELRSPLTALTVQAENLERSIMSDEAKTRIQFLKAGLGRTSKLLEQLLNFARCQNTSAPTSEIKFDDLVRSVMEEYLPFAQSKLIDFGCKRFEPVSVHAPPEDMRMLVRNAIDNALRYTQPIGTVDVSLYNDSGQAVFLVEDNGPGFPAGEIERVFEPFYRILGNGETGSGLGLSIIRNIAGHLGGTVELGNKAESRGVRFSYRQSHTRES